MRLWLTKPDHHDLIVDGIMRAKIWFQQPHVDPGSVCLFSRSRYDDFMYSEWKARDSVSVKTIGKTLPKLQQELFYNYIAAQMRSTHKWPELDWWDWLEKTIEVLDHTRSAWYEVNSRANFDHEGFFHEAVNLACDRAICKDEASLRFEWCHQFNLLEVINVENRNV